MLVFVSVRVHDDDDSADDIKTDGGEPALVLGLVVHGDGMRVQEHAFRVREAHAMLAYVFLSFARIPRLVTTYALYAYEWRRQVFCLTVFCLTVQPVAQ